MAEVVRLIHPEDRVAGTPTNGMVREEAISTDHMWAGVAATEPGMVSDWHNHGTYESTIYVQAGGLRMEFGPGGADVLDAGPGDFLYVAPHAVHREGNPTDVEARIVVVRSGSGEPVFNVGGPG